MAARFALPWAGARATTLRRFALALAIAAAGGALFDWLGMPLAWMIGAMVFTTAAALGGAPVHMFPSLRMVMIAVLGVMLGSAFTPELMARAGGWLTTLAGLAIYAVVVGALVLIYLRRVAGYGPATAYFSASPGGLNEMIIVGTAHGGEDRTISLIHSTRVLLMVLGVPLWFRLFGGYEAARRAAANVSIVDVPAADLAVLALCAVAGAAAARAVRLPAAFVTGPMLASALVHLLGVTDSRPPFELIALAQLVIGAAIGCRFAGVPLSFMGRTLVHGGAATAIMLSMTVAATLGLRQLTGVPFDVLLLALTPGGLAEMSLIALALDIDAAFVATHHIFRIALVVILAPIVFRIGARLFWHEDARCKAKDT